MDLASGRPYPFEPDAAFFFADFSGALAELSPRVQLAAHGGARRSLWVAGRGGLGIRTDRARHATSTWPAGITGRGPLRPAMASNRCWSALTPAVQSEALAGLCETLAAGGVPVDHLCAELGPGCLELATEHRPALRSADDAALAKLFTKAFYARRGQTATFMAQLAEGFPGSRRPPQPVLASGSRRTPARGRRRRAICRLWRAPPWLGW